MAKITTAPKTDQADSPSLWQRINTKLDRFINVAVAAAPTVLLYSGLALAGSYGLSHVAGGWDPLRVVGNDTQMIVQRLLGSVLIGGAISGGLDMVNNSGACGDEPCNLPVANQKKPAASAPSATPAFQHEPPLPTPVLRRNGPAAGRQGQSAGLE